MALQLSPRKEDYLPGPEKKVKMEFLRLQTHAKVNKSIDYSTRFHCQKQLICNKALDQSSVTRKAHLGSINTDEF